MSEVVGVRFKHAGKIYYFSPGNLKLAAADKVIVETTRGIEYGELVIPPREVMDEDVVMPLKQVMRKATSEDEKLVEQNKKKEKEAYQICLKKITEHQLPMKLVDVEYTFDGNKIIFSFTAEGRVDFRELVKDLAAIFRTRIELRQIGVRDEAKMLGGIGSCGRILCCSSFLGDFEPVSIRMAKDQKLSLNPTKISGICGRLMCCLKYENGCYKPEGKGKCECRGNLPEEEQLLELVDDSTPRETSEERPVMARPEVKGKSEGEGKGGNESKGVGEGKGVSKGQRHRSAGRPKGKSEKV